MLSIFGCSKANNLTTNTPTVDITEKPAPTEPVIEPTPTEEETTIEQPTDEVTDTPSTPEPSTPGPTQKPKETEKPKPTEESKPKPSVAKKTMQVYDVDKITDVSETDSFYQALVNLKGYNALFVYDDWTFMPNQNITYAEFVQMLIYAYAPTFDVSKFDSGEHWAQVYVTALSPRIYSVEKLNLTVNNLDNNISKIKVIKCVIEAFALLRHPGSYETPTEQEVLDLLANIKDFDSSKCTEDPYYLGFALYYNWISPDSNGNLYSEGLITRGEAVKLLDKICNP